MRTCVQCVATPTAVMQGQLESFFAGEILSASFGEGLLDPFLTLAQNPQFEVEKTPPVARTRHRASDYQDHARDGDMN